MAAAATASSSSSSYSNKRKHPIISISSSSSESSEDDEDDIQSEYEDEEEEEEEEEVEDEASDSEFEPESDEDDGEDRLSEDGSGGSSNSDDDDDCDDDDDGDDGEGSNGDLKWKGTDEEQRDKVISLLQRGKSLNQLKLEECKAYLRKHELRISGTKSSCIDRIVEHWRIKDGDGEKLYPASSFVINCTGDVCTGDVVLFKQKVYEKFDLVKRGGGGKVIGKRIIAGRIVKESYGGSKQQHTFSVDVLWSKGVKALSPLFPLLVKGRNLYRMKTFRQPWKNEAMRLKILDEKHRRGAAARHVRAIARATASNKGSKRKRNSSKTRAPPNKQREKSKLALKNSTQPNQGPPNKQRRKESELVTKKKQKGGCQPNHELPNKRRKKDSKLATNKKKQKCAKRRKKDSKLATNKKKQKCANQLKQSPPNNHRKRDVIQNFAGESYIGNTQVNIREVEPTSSLKFCAPSEQPRYHPNRFHRENPCPQRFPHGYNNHPPVVPFHMNNTGISHPYRAHYTPTYHMENIQSSMNHYPSETRPPHSYISYRTSYGYPAFQQDPRRQVADGRLSAGQYYGWQRP